MQTYQGHANFDSMAEAALTTQSGSVGTYRMLSMPVISTSHISTEVCQQMLVQGNQYAGCLALSWDCGHFLYPACLDEDAPQCLHDIARWLKSQGHVDCWVRLDEAAAEVPGLPTYG